MKSQPEKLWVSWAVYPALRVRYLSAAKGQMATFFGVHVSIYVETLGFLLVQEERALGRYTLCLGKVQGVC